MKKAVAAFFAFLIAGALAVSGSVHAEEISSPTPTSPDLASGPSLTPSGSPPQELAAKTSMVSALSPTATNAISLGIIGLRDSIFDDGAIIFAEYEKKLTRRRAFFTRFAWLKYRPNGLTDHYGEGGSGAGIELGARVYIALQEKVNLYLGAGVGEWRLKWYWKDEEKAPFQNSGSWKSWATSFQVHAGWKIGLRNGMYLNPSLQGGFFFPQRNDDPMKFGNGYGSIGLAVGRPW